MDPAAASPLLLAIEAKDHKLAIAHEQLADKGRELALAREQLAGKDREHALALQLRDARERELAREADAARREAEGARRETEALRRENEALRGSASSAQSALVQGALAAALQEERARLARDETAARFRRDQRALWLRSTDGLAAVFTIVAQCKFELGAAPAACRALRGDTALWDVIKDVQNGARGWTWLHYASEVGDLARVQFLLDRGADLNARTLDDATPLMLAACCSASAHVLGALLARGADANASDHLGNASIYFASAFGNIEAVRILLNSGANVDIANGDGETALFRAVYRGHIEIAKELIARGAAVDHARVNGATPLMIAAVFDRIETARVLLTHGASKTAVDREGKTAYAHAEGKSAELCALLKP